MGGPVGPPGGQVPGSPLGGPGGKGDNKKPRARKGSKLEDPSDYESYLENIMSHLKTMPPVNTVEPKIKTHFSGLASNSILFCYLFCKMWIQ